MLKALELAGFKSFADKTRFEFDRGITVVVGPNGSGKSNVVDGIKWVLGEQSAKTLRGKEMADVIFNGSGSRRALNSAEATLTFDNSQRLLAIDAPEVQITRRVFRSGEGEYLINRQPCRLRDIRDLFSGTGMATEAYSVIEQGKVDVMLQSSPRDRRIIFEEAAGISRFKAKKVEALRRLERVEQNLLRLSDIVDEVENRLKTVRAQAAKARKYREYSQRLQHLRTHVGLVDWRALTDKLLGLERESEAAHGEAATTTAAAEAVELQIVEIESRLSELDTLLRTSEARVAQNHERIVLLDSTIEHQRARTKELDEQAADQRRRVAMLTARAARGAAQRQQAIEAVNQVEAQRKILSSRVADDERALTELTGKLDELRNESDQRRTAHAEQSRVVAALGSEIVAIESQAEAALVGQQRSQTRLAELDAGRAAVESELASLRATEKSLDEEAAAAAAARDAAANDLAELRRQWSAMQPELLTWRQRLSGALERASVLEELEKRHEGLGAGVKQVLATAASDAPGVYGAVRGVVADLLRVDMQSAALVEVALGELAQHVVVDGGPELLAKLTAQGAELTGRVGFLRLERASVAAEGVDLSGRPGVVGRADKYVQADAAITPLVERLLGRTWLVEELAHALALAETAPGHAFVTAAGELVDRDGTLVVGPRHASTGLLSRRSELRALREQITHWEATIVRLQEQSDALEQSIAEHDKQLAACAIQQREAEQRLHSHRLKLGAVDERAAQLSLQHEAIARELTTATERHAQLTQSLADARRRLVEAELRFGQTEAHLHDHSDRIHQLDHDRQGRTGRATQSKVELAKIEQQLDGLHAQLRRFEQEHAEGQRAIAEANMQLERCVQRALAAEHEILAAESESALLFLRKEHFGAETAEAAVSRDVLREDRSIRAAEAQRLRSKIRKLEEKWHKRDLAASEVRHERSALADRMREDYEIDLATSAEQPESGDGGATRAEIEAEIAELRQKIGSIGGVNLDALQEADELETRFGSLSAQFQDLSSAKASLEQIIGKINGDSRRLFAETLETVKGHFQGLFRKLFGGGQADIILDEGVDILDSGIEIVARPPGKEPRNISLLSGGEKTLTCVALLLSIFRSRPSPFCVLDEVDAALDEANIQRFTGVLTEFLAWTQFIVITHSKKTMTCASTLYGVTMQESGISKRVSVRFEDVSDNGEILNVRDEEEEEGEDDAEDNADEPITELMAETPAPAPDKTPPTKPERKKKSGGTQAA